MLENQVSEVRSIETITCEIKTICAQARTMALVYSVEIGRRLVEAKALLPHGEWGKWLLENFDFSQRSANNFMELYKEYSSDQTSLFGAELKSQSFANLTYSKALKLLAVADCEREEFVKNNDVENMSVKELEKAIRERDEALKKADELLRLNEEYEKAGEKAEEVRRALAECEKEKNGLLQEITDLSEKLEKEKEKRKKAEQNPEISKERLKQIKDEAAEEAKSETQDAIDKALERTKELERQIEALKKEAEDANRSVEELKRKQDMSSPEIVAFKTLFEQVQDGAVKLKDHLGRIEDAEVKEKLTKALCALGDMIKG